MRHRVVSELDRANAQRELDEPSSEPRVRAFLRPAYTPKVPLERTGYWDRERVFATVLDEVDPDRAVRRMTIRELKDIVGDVTGISERSELENRAADVMRSKNAAIT